MYQEIFIQAFVYLAAAVLAVPVARRLGLGSALGYLLAGVLIGPFVLGLVGEKGQDVMHFAEFGVVLMLFLVGLELEPAKLWRLRVPIIGLGGLQVATTALVVGALCLWAGYAWQTALLIGLVLALSSTAIVLQTLEEKGWMKTAAGQRSFSVLLFQDIAVIPILAVIPFLAVAGIEASGDGHGVTHADRPGWLQALLVLAVVAAIWFAGHYLARPVFRWIARTGTREVFMATALLLIVGVVLAMNFVGLSPALGAFLAGVVLAENEFRHQLESDIEPFKGLLLGLFFISVGAAIDLHLVVGQPFLVLGLVFALMAVKFVLLLLLGRAFRLPLGDAMLFAFALAQGGEFAFLLLSFALQTGAIAAPDADLIVVVVVLSMMLTPLTVILFERVIRPRLLRSAGSEPEEDVEDLANPVIIAGYGRFGQVVGRLLRAAGYPATLLDHDAGQIELTARFGNKVFYGDASRADLLEAAGARDARLLVIAIDDPDKAVRMVETAKMQFPHLKVLARALDRPHTYRLIRAGVDFFARETFGSALALGEEALRLLGVSDDRARRMARRFEEHDTDGLLKLYEVWGDDETYGFHVRQNLDELAKVLQDDREDERVAPPNTRDGDEEGVRDGDPARSV